MTTPEAPVQHTAGPMEQRLLEIYNPSTAWSINEARIFESAREQDAIRADLLAFAEYIANLPNVLGSSPETPIKVKAEVIAEKARAAIARARGQAAPAHKEPAPTTPRGCRQCVQGLVFVAVPR